jgi:hypothetical protein
MTDMRDFLVALPPKISASLTWTNINRLTGSFLSRAVTAWSLSILILTTLPDAVLDSTGLAASAAQMFWGAAAFLTGYLAATVLQPAEMAGVRDILVSVAHMKSIEYEGFYQSRKEMLQSLCDRMQCASRPTEAASALALQALEHAELNQATLATTLPSNGRTWRDWSAEVYHADLFLRQYDRKGRLLVSLALLAFGIILLISPVLPRVYSIITRS